MRPRHRALEMNDRRPQPLSVACRSRSGPPSTPPEQRAARQNCGHGTHVTAAGAVGYWRSRCSPLGSRRAAARAGPSHRGTARPHNTRARVADLAARQRRTSRPHRIPASGGGATALGSGAPPMCSRLGAHGQHPAAEVSVQRAFRCGESPPRPCRATTMSVTVHAAATNGRYRAQRSNSPSDTDGPVQNSACRSGLTTARPRRHARPSR